MRSCLLALFFICTLISSAQRTIDVGKNDVRAGDADFFFVVGGEPFINTKFVRLVQGTPYFKDQWMKGSVTVMGGREYANLTIKLELIDNQVHFLDSSGKEMIATGDLKQVKLIGDESNGYTFIHSAFMDAANIQRGWYRLMSDGKKASFFKQHGKRLREMKPYGSATYEQYIDDFERLFILHNNNFTEFNKTKDLVEIFVDKKTEVQQFITQQKLSSKSEADFIKVVNYYNSLQ